jgi:drug/metabolite transporter (DMT)-like permease
VRRAGAGSRGGLHPGIVLAVPPLFVVIWSTGYITARYALPDAEPMHFLAWRYALAALLLMVVALLAGQAWGRRSVDVLHASLTGISLHALGLGGVFLAIDRDVEPAVSALIMALQPVLTALFAALALRERPRPLQLLGLVLGFAGVALVVASRLGEGAGDLQGVAWNLMGVVAVTAGTLYQKARSQGMGFFPGLCIQFSAATLACVALSALFAEGDTAWTVQVLGALAWAVLGLSLAATSLLYWMIRRGAMAAVASLFYLIPVSAALLAWVLFDQPVTPSALLGMAITVAGVVLVTRSSRP